MPLYSKLFAEKNLIIFDIDGTLIDTIPIHVAALTQAYEINGKVPSPDTRIIRKNLGLPSEKYAETVFQEHGIPNPTHEDIQQILEYHFQKLAGNDSILNTEHIIPGVRILLEKLLKDRKHLAIVSGNTRKSGEGILQKTNLIHYFETRVYSSDTFRGKPIKTRSQMVQKVLEEIQKKDKNVTADTCMLVGDTPHDIEAAHGAGIDSIGVGTGSHSKEEIMAEKPTFWVDHF